MEINFTYFGFLLFIFSNVFAQNQDMSEPENKFKKNSLFMNIGYVLNPENQAYTLLYKRNFKRKALRLGFSASYRSLSQSQQTGNFDRDWLDNKIVIGFECGQFVSTTTIDVSNINSFKLSLILRKQLICFGTDLT